MVIFQGEDERKIVDVRKEQVGVNRAKRVITCSAFHFECWMQTWDADIEEIEWSMFSRDVSSETLKLKQYTTQNCIQLYDS